MGINVIDKVVFYDANHQKLVNTCPTSNPTKTVIQNLTVHSVFQRVPERNSSGDGNPLIYALKGIKDYKISEREVRHFLPGFYNILSSLQPECGGAILIPMPSKHSIAMILAKRIQKLCPGSSVHSGLFVKRTCGEVHADLVQVNHPASKTSDFKKLLAFLKKNSDNHVSLKDIDVKLRRFTNPLSVKPGAQLPNVANAPIVLVDDLMATGSTLLGARDLFLKQGKQVDIKGLCLFSRL